MMAVCTIARLGAMENDKVLCKFEYKPVYKVSANTNESPSLYTALESGVGISEAIGQCIPNSYFLNNKSEMLYAINPIWKTTPLGYVVRRFAEDLKTHANGPDWFLVIGQLLKTKADVNAIDVYGKTPLRTLVELQKVDPNAGIDAIDLQVARVIRLLIKNGADISKNACGVWARLLLKMACSSSKTWPKMVVHAVLHPEWSRSFFEKWLKKDTAALSTVFSYLLKIDKGICTDNLTKNPHWLGFYLASIAIKNGASVELMGLYNQVPAPGLRPVLFAKMPLLTYLFDNILKEQKPPLVSKKPVCLEEGLDSVPPSPIKAYLPSSNMLVLTRLSLNKKKSVSELEG